MRSTAALATLLLLLRAAPLAAQEKAAPPAAPALFPATTASPQAAAELRAAWDADYALAYPDAVEHARKALELDPSYALARAWGARFLAPAERRPEGEKAAEAAARVSTPEALLLLWLRDFYAGRGGGIGPVLNDAVVRLFPGDPAIVTGYAINLGAGQKRNEALRAAVKQFPDYVPAKLRLVNELAGVAFGVATPEALAEATSLAQDAVRLAPENPEALAALALALDRSRKFDEAFAYAARAGAAGPRSFWAQMAVAEGALQQGKPADGRIALQRAAELYPFPQGKVNLAVAAALTPLWDGNARAAIAELDEIARKAEADGLPLAAGYAHVFCALALGAARDPSAQQHIDAARRLGTTGFWVDQDEVLANAMAGQAQAARAGLAAVEKSATGTAEMPRAGTLHLATGFVLLAEKRPAEALAELKQVPNDNIVAQMGMVEAYRALGRKAEAKAERDKLFARQDFAWNGMGMPVAHYRLR